MIEFGGENKEINKKCKTAPFMLSLEDTPDNVLRIVIAFPMEGEEGADLDNFPEPYKSRVEDILIHSKPAFEDMDRVYEIIFDDYIIYQNRNESYTSWDDYEVRKGSLIRQGNGKFYVSAVFGYYRDITATEDYQRYLEEIHKPYWIVWYAEKKRLIRWLAMVPNTHYLIP